MKSFTQEDYDQVAARLFDSNYNQCTQDQKDQVKIALRLLN